MNCYYSNLIEGHDTRPRDIERALAGYMDQSEDRRNLQRAAIAHIRVQIEIDRLASVGTRPEPASGEFNRWFHREFYIGAADDMVRCFAGGRQPPRRLQAFRNDFQTGDAQSIASIAPHHGRGHGHRQTVPACSRC
jgi:Fic family protein